MAAHDTVIPYLKVAAELRNRIDQGVYEVGTQLPSGRVLADELGVARNTVGAAIRVLREEGLVTPVAGRGTVVEARPEAAVESSPEMTALMEKMEALIEKLNSLQDEVKGLDQRLRKLEP
ncbi:GntR family transcriptional regulator [Nocardiopsis suaedae]|uniref:Winged helix-turn-helix domain-containing protein n=1 Tax=Nocardiopsis suaedae TaxID=3018444 RepID=A0ABT4TIN4_9ACTN|nr:winged helix-turn-helix domain-containing protein [Nocardiopsis suaedae]MDA2804547.1 winged helix-turn-helix domain-containing protein [Nocardiopsis suaedae]